MIKNNYLKLLILLIVFSVAVAGWNCRKQKAKVQSTSEPLLEDIKVSDNGDTITLSEAQAGKFETENVKDQKLVITMKIYARTLAGVSRDSSLIIFESAELTEMYSNYIRSRAEYDRTEKQEARLANLYKQDAVSGKEVLDAETDNRLAAASLRDSEGRIRQAGIPPRIFKKLSRGSYLIVADVPESRIDVVEPGEKAEIEFNSFPGKIYKGSIISIADAVDPVTRTIRVGIIVHDTHGHIRPGMFARVSIDEKIVNAFRIPVTAVFNADGNSYIFIKTGNNSFHRRKVLIGESNEQFIQVLSGLKRDEKVVISNVILLKGLSVGY